MRRRGELSKKQKLRDWPHQVAILGLADFPRL
jgi:hypothetical protein